MERKIGEIFEYNGEWYQCVEGIFCKSCGFYQPNVPALQCGRNFCCFGYMRKDKTSVIFKKLEKVGEPFTGKVHIQLQRYKIYTEPIINSIENVGYIDEGNTIAIEIKQNKEDMEVKIQIPDNCELIKNGDTYIVKEKKDNKPRSWEEFCENYPLTGKEYFINMDSIIKKNVYNADAYINRSVKHGKNWINSKEEAEAFLALMQLRQLRKAWVGDWTNVDSAVAYSIYVDTGGSLEVAGFGVDRVLNFPTNEMAEDFLGCFKDLCETAKMLL